MTPERGDRVMAMRSEGDWRPAVFVGPVPNEATGLVGLRPEDLSMVQFDGETEVRITYARPLEAEPSDS